MQTTPNPLRTRFTRRTGVAGGAALALPLVGGLGQAFAAPAGAASGAAGAVYTLTNAPGGNAVAVFDRAAAGTLATGGNGTGTGLGSQGALALSVDGGWLYAVNPGSDTIAVLPVTDT